MFGVDNQKNPLIEMVLLSTHNILLLGNFEKISKLFLILHSYTEASA